MLRNVALQLALGYKTAFRLHFPSILSPLNPKRTHVTCRKWELQLHKEENVFQGRYLFMQNYFSVLGRWEKGLCLVNLLTGQVYLQNKEVVQETPHVSNPATGIWTVPCYCHNCVVLHNKISGGCSLTRMAIGVRLPAGADIFCFITAFVDQDSSVVIATRYGLDGPGIESQWGRDFRHPTRPTLGPTQPPVHWVPVIPGGKAAGALPPHLTSRLKKEWGCTCTPPLYLRGRL